MLPNEITRRCVVLFARTPSHEGRAKRLRHSARLFAYARQRVEIIVSALGVDLLIATGSGEGNAAPLTFAQSGDSFGSRFENAAAHAVSLGYDEIVIVPTDVPQLSRDEVALAFAAIGKEGTVLGPSSDGGIYLFGFRAGTRLELHSVVWQTASVLADLRRLYPCSAALPQLRDIDSLDDVVLLRREPSLHRRLISLADAVLTPDRVVCGRDEPPASRRPVVCCGRAPPDREPLFSCR